jgi:hypothetical protein
VSRDRLFAISTETNHAARRAAIETHLDPDVELHDPDGEFVGYDALEAFGGSRAPIVWSGPGVYHAGPVSCMRTAARSDRTVDHKLTAGFTKTELSRQARTPIGELRFGSASSPSRSRAVRDRGAARDDRRQARRTLMLGVGSNGEPGSS